MTTLVQKLRIIERTTVVTLNAPADYAKTLGKLPKGAIIVSKLGSSCGFIHLFVRDKAELEGRTDQAGKAVAPDGLLWISYPKGAKTDLTRDKGWECLERLDMQWLASISFNADWSAFLMKNASPKAPSRASKDYHAKSSSWADRTTKTVKLPDDLAAALKKDAMARAVYEALAYTNKKEYVLWIVGAKREETRVDRLTKTMAKLRAGKKNPAEK